MANKLHILACAYFVRDVKAALALIDDNSDVEVISFPADCGRPQLSEEDVNTLVPETNDTIETLILGNVCINNEINNPSPVSSSHYRHFEQCFHIICPPQLVNQYLAKGDYLLSPGWLSGWSKNVRKLGFNEQDAKDFFKQSINKLRLIDTGVNSKSKKQLKELSNQVGITTKTVPVGLDYLSLLLEKEIRFWKQRNALKRLSEQQHVATNYATAYEMISQLSRSSSEAEIIDGILELFNLLFAPEEIAYIPVSKSGEFSSPVTLASNPDIAESIIDKIPRLKQDFFLCASGSGFLLSIKHKESEFGYLLIDQIAMPQYIRSYLNHARNLVSVCALLIENARIQHKLIDTAHLAGKAELAIEVLHNIGNVINSVGISTNIIREQINNSVCSRIPAIVELLEQHKENMSDFIDNDPRGKNIPAFFSALNEEHQKQYDANIAEIERLISNVEQIKGIVRSQQAHCHDNRLVEKISCEIIISEIINMYSHKLEQHKINLEKDFSETGIQLLPKYQLLQIVGNLVINAIDSLSLSKTTPRELTLKTGIKDGDLHILVSDNGLGIESSEQVKIFQHGYTTKQNHSGFGLHSASNLASEIGGKLTVTSEGKNKGASFTLILPLENKKTGLYND